MEILELLPPVEQVPGPIEVNLLAFTNGLQVYSFMKVKMDLRINYADSGKSRISLGPMLIVVIVVILINSENNLTLATLRLLLIHRH